MKNNESIIDKSALIYSEVRIVNSIIGENCVIGDNSDIVDSFMANHSEFGRRNIVRNVSMGTGSYTGTNSVLKMCEVGKYCSISWNTSIGGGSHNYHNVSMYTDYWFERVFGLSKRENEINKNKKTIIGNDVWIAAGAHVLRGIHIGDGAVVAANAVVTKDVPPYAIVAGVPARIIKYRFEKDIIDLLLKIEWWNWPTDMIKRHIDILRSKPSKEKLLKLIKSI